MITKYKNLGFTLSQKEMKKIKGGAKPPHYWWWDCTPVGGGGPVRTYCSDFNPMETVACSMECTDWGLCTVPTWPAGCPF